MQQAAAGPAVAGRRPPAGPGPAPERAARSAAPVTCRPAAAGRGPSAGRTGWTKRVHWPRGWEGEGEGKRKGLNSGKGGSVYIRTYMCNVK